MRLLLKTGLSAGPDQRRPQGRLSRLQHLRLVSILAVLSHAASYRKLERFIQARVPRLNVLCDLNWTRAPAHPASRYAFHGLHPADVEAAFRRHAATLDGQRNEQACIALEGKTLRGSVDRFAEQQAIQVLSALTTDSPLVLGQVLIRAAAPDKSHELAAAQHLIQELGLSGRVFTLEALHAPKHG